jgi:hypothetical protein
MDAVVDAPGAGSAEEGEGFVMRIEDHLLGLAGIGANEDHPAVAEPDMRDLHRRREAVDHRDLFVGGTVHWTVPSSSSPPVELVGLARIEAQRHVGCRRGLALRLRPRGRIPPHGVITAPVAECLELFEDPDTGQPLALRLVSGDTTNWPPGDMRIWPSR